VWDYRRRGPLTRRRTPFMLLRTAVLVIGLVAVGTHEIAVHSQPCWGGSLHVLHCAVRR